MKVVLLAGGLGTRISEESAIRPKPMIEIGGRPILWHIMKTYAHHGLRDFIVCLGYKGYIIKEYFTNFVLHHSDITINLAGNDVTYHQTMGEPWRVTLIDTGEHTRTGGRLKRVRSYLDQDQPFCFTYGDGLADLDVGATIAYHRAHGKLATITAIAPPSRYGALALDSEKVIQFIEKPAGEQGFVNGGFFVLDATVVDRIAGDDISWENDVLPGLAVEGELFAYQHHGFWHAMDTLRDKNLLEELWQSGRAPWKTWT
jgi:glucose-1-phosphate cytidylyltransferase